MGDELKNIALLICYGIKDCFWGILSLRHFLFSKDEDPKLKRFPAPEGNRQVKDILLQCLCFGVLFWISNYVFNRFILNEGFSLFAAFMDVDVRDAAWLQNFLYGLLCVTWIFPLLILSKVLNFIWYQDIADLTFKKTGIVKGATMSFSELVADQIKSLILQVLFCLQGYIIYLLIAFPAIPYLWYLIHLSLLSSLYAFEYKWMYMGWPLSRRILTIERKWPYFIGFGLPLAIVTTYIPSFIDSMIIFATLFPIYVIGSALTFDSLSPTCNRPIHSFKLVDSVSETIMSSCLNLGTRNIRR